MKGIKEGVRKSVIKCPRCRKQTAVKTVSPDWYGELDEIHIVCVSCGYQEGAQKQG